jgi:NAD(P)-dependent dehydrogenase (short-subunit alcohol dehydrogenase family)
MLLKNKNAVIYGAGGSIGSTVARAFAREGAAVFLSGRTASSLEAVAKDIVAAGGVAETAIVDALDEKAVDEYVDDLVKRKGHIDISFNLIWLNDVHGVPIVEMELDDFTRPVNIAMKTQFLTSRAVARHMIKQGSGVIISLTATPAGKAYAMTGGFGPACTAMEGFSRNLAAELGPYGVRVVGIRSAGSPDSAVFISSMSGEGTLAKMALQQVIDDTMLKKLPVMEEIANVAVFLVSDKAGGMTGTFANVTCGTTRD